MPITLIRIHEKKIQRIKSLADTLTNAGFFDILICSSFIKDLSSKWPKKPKFDLFFDPRVTPN